MIKKFKEYISEGMWKSGLDRAKSGTKRLEDRTMMDELCDEIGHIIAEYMEVKYDPKLCYLVPKPIMNTKEWSKVRTWKVNFGSEVFYVKIDLSSFGYGEFVWECWLRFKLEEYKDGEYYLLRRHAAKSLVHFKDQCQIDIMNGETDEKVSHILNYIIKKLEDEI